MKLNLRLGKWPKARRSAAVWGQRVDVVLADGCSQSLEIVRRLPVAGSAGQAGLAWTPGGAAGRASFTFSCGPGRFLAERKSRQLLGWLRRQEGVVAVSAGVLGHER